MAEQGWDMGSTVMAPTPHFDLSQGQLEKPEGPPLPEAPIVL